MVVIDASAIIDLFLGNLSIGRRLRGEILHAPVSVDAEVLHSLRRNWVQKKIDADRAAWLIESLRGVEIIRHPVADLTQRMWALRDNVSAYDAGYVVLAEMMDVPLITRDGRLSRSSGHNARIEYIA